MTLSSPPITIACAADFNHTGGYFRTLQRQIRERGLWFHFQEISPFSWAALVEWELAYCRQHPGERVVFVDTEDFLMLGSAEELEAATAAQPLLFHAEARCWPEAWKADLYPKTGAASLYRYVNGTGPAGSCDAIAEAIEWGLANCPIRGREASIFADNDQRFFTDVYLSGRGAVDDRQLLSVQMNALGEHDFEITNGRLIVKATGTKPVFLHLNGASRRTCAELVQRLGIEVA